MAKEKEIYKAISKKYDYREITLLLLIIFLSLGIVGSGMNTTAIKENSGKMPFYGGYNSDWPLEYRGTNYFSYDSFDKINFPYLTDMMLMPYFNIYFSIGDVLIYIAYFILIIVVYRTLKMVYVYYKYKNNSRRKKILE